VIEHFLLTDISCILVFRMDLIQVWVSIECKILRIMLGEFGGLVILRSTFLVSHL
jgi:hypothetical protein